MTGRWSDLIDLAALTAGQPYPSTEEADEVLWEHTPFPMGSTEQVWDAARAFYAARAKDRAVA